MLSPWPSSQESSGRKRNTPILRPLAGYRPLHLDQRIPVMRVGAAAGDAMRSLEATLAVAAAGATGREVTLSEPALRR